MSTKTIRSVVPMRHNLWKDFHQSKSVLLAVAVCHLLIQLILVGGNFLRESATGWGDVVQATLITAAVGALVTVIGSAAMMVGHERQSGTWGWASSLPVSWAHTLFSKLIVSIASSTLIALVLCCVPACVYMFTSTSVGRDNTDSEYFVTVATGIYFQAIALFFLCTLLFKDAMTGVVVAAVSSIGIQFLVAAVMIESDSKHFWSWRLLDAIITALVFVCMILVYRWRWRLGQNSRFTLQSPGASHSIATKIQYFGFQPSEGNMLLSLSGQNHLVLRFLVSLISLHFIIGTALASGTIDVTAIPLGLAAVVLGLTAFSGDQTNGRFRFMADRGVIPSKMVTSRLIVPFGILLTLALIDVAVFSIVQDSWHSSRWILQTAVFGIVSFVFGSCLFLLGAFASLCFRQSIIAGFAAASVSIMALILYINACEANVSGWNIAWIGENAVAWSIIVPLVLLIAIYRSGRRWIEHERPHFFWSYVGTCFLSIIVPLVLSATFSFLGIPTRPNVESSMAHRLEDTASLPPLGPVVEALTLDLEPGPDESKAQFKMRMAEQATTAIANARTAFAEPKITKRLDEKQIQLMNRLIHDSAELAMTQMRVGNIEEARLAWKLCNTFHENCGTRLGLLTLPMLRNARGTLEQEPNEQRDLLGDSTDFLRSSEIKLLSATMGMQRMAEIKALRRIQPKSDAEFRPSVSRPWIALYPPIRWRLEREVMLRNLNQGAIYKIR
jgi:hypothetical protein